MAKSIESQKHISEQLKEVDESLRIKYREFLDNLSINEVTHFQIDKNKYKQMILSEIVPEADSTQIDDTAQYISNYLNNEAPSVMAHKIQMSQPT